MFEVFLDPILFFVDVISGWPPQLSWFLACVALDQRRIDQKRNGILPFIVHKDWLRPEGSGKDIGTVFLSRVSKLLQSGPFQALVIIVTLATLSVGIWGTYEIHVEYDFVNLLPRGSYMREWIDQGGYSIHFQNCQKWPQNCFM